MKNKKIDNNSKFLFMMSGFFVLLLVISFASNSASKVTYSASCSGTIKSNYCCGNGETYTIAQNVYEQDARAMCASFSTGITTDTYYENCEVTSQGDGYYKVTATRYKNCELLEATCPTYYQYSSTNGKCYRSMTAGTYLASESVSAASTCPKGYYCPGGTIYNGESYNVSNYKVKCPEYKTTIGTGAKKSSDCVYDCSLGTRGSVISGKHYFELTFPGTDITGFVNSCCSTNGGTVKGNKCYVCESSNYVWSSDENCCVARPECTGSDCVCDNSGNGKYDNTEAERVAKEECGVNNYGLNQNSNGCFTYTCNKTDLPTTCDASKNEFKTEAERDAAIIKNCKYGNRKWTADNGCYKYECDGAPSSSNSSSVKPSSSSASSIKPSSSSASSIKPSSSSASSIKPSSSVKHSSNSQDIHHNPDTGSLLTYMVAVLGIIMVVYSLWYFKKNEE